MQQHVVGVGGHGRGDWSGDVTPCRGCVASGPPSRHNGVPVGHHGCVCAIEQGVCKGSHVRQLHGEAPREAWQQAVHGHASICTHSSLSAWLVVGGCWEGEVLSACLCLQGVRGQEAWARSDELVGASGS